MATAIIIDDERPALRVLEHFLKENGEIDVLGMCIDPLEGIGQISQLKPDIVFLDIEMPQISGIDAAAKILDIDSDVEIVFVTAYNQYAVEAFELNALDYLLKPFSKERLNKTIMKIINRISGKKQRCEKKVSINCLGRFEILVSNQEPLKWRSEKTKEIFAYLLHNREKEIAKEELIERLWYNTEFEKAVHQLHNGIYYIRKALSEYSISKAQICISGSYCLKLGDVDCDVALFEKYMAENKELSVSELEHITSIYKGDYFAGEDWVWIDYDREVFLRHYSNAMIRLAEKYLTGRQAEKAELILLKAFNINPYEENITALLMELYKASGKKAEAAKHYKAFEKLLKQDLGIYPSDKIRESFYSIN